MSRHECVGALLAGGKSQRMGRDKAGLRFTDGRTFSELVVETLRRRCEQVVILGHGRGTESLSLDRLPDPRRVEGPIAGLLSLLRSGLAQRYLICACDAPEVGVEDLDRLLAEPGAAAGFWNARRAGWAAPPLMVRAEVLRPLEAYVHAAGRSVRGLLDVLEATRIEADDARLRRLHGYNRPEELPRALHSLDPRG